MVELSGESLQPLLTWRPGDPGPRPGFGGRGEDLRYMQGTVVRWDPETAENIVRIRGTDHTNVPLIDLGIGQRSIQAGDQVAIMSWSPNGGTAAYFVMGRLVVPGTTAAARSADALSTMASDVTQEMLTSPAGQTLAAWVLAQRVRHGEGIGFVTVDTEDTWTAGTGGQVPTVSDVPVSSSGIALVWLAAHCEPWPDDGETGTALMSFQVSGATSMPPDLGRSTGIGRRAVAAGDTVVPAGRVGALIALTNLNEGLHTFAGRFRHSSSGSGASNFARFSSMTIAVMGL